MKSTRAIRRHINRRDSSRWMGGTPKYAKLHKKQPRADAGVFQRPMNLDDVQLIFAKNKAA